MRNRWSRRSKDHLLGVHPDLTITATTALHKLECVGIDAAVIDGPRTKTEQSQNIIRGVSWTMDSDHIPRLVRNKEGINFYLADAIDIIPLLPGNPDWDSPPMINAFMELGRCMRESAREHGVALRWGANIEYGGDWLTKNDMPHFYRITSRLIEA